MDYVAAFFRPSPEINYKVISALHLLFSVLCIGLYLVEIYDLFGEKAVEGCAAHFFHKLSMPDSQVALQILDDSVTLHS